MPDETKRPLKVFLCHAHPDADKVRALYARLKADGVDAWLDKENIIPGQDWEMEIRKAVRESDIVVVCLSKQFSQKGYRQNEVRIALEEASLQPEGEIFIIPARLEECNYLESLKRFHGVDLFEERGYEYLMRALRLRADKIGAVLQSKKGWLNGFTAPVKKPAPKKLEPVKPLPTPKAEESKPVITQNLRENGILKYIAAIVGMVIIIAVIFGVPWVQWFASAPNFTTVTQTRIATFSPSSPTSTSTSTPTSPAKTETPTLALTATSQPTELTDDKGVEMVLVPAGKFTMGVDATIACQNETSIWLDCEKTYKENAPLQSVTLDAFYIDKYEVTNAKYSECVSAQQCKPPSQLKVGNLDYYGNKKYDSYPVVWVGDAMAKQYCLWRGARLPSSSEWEKAARGTDQRIYPWGNEENFDLRANGPESKDGFPYLAPVGSFPLGASPYGALDMAGNVAELVNTNDVEYYSTTYIRPMVKGGGWNGRSLINYEYSGLWYVEGGDGSTGFRCARDVNP
jgi:formylglycine-generating enzyme required for sulfatase activity